MDANNANLIDTTIFELTGSHYDIGLAIGRGSQRFTPPAWWPEPPPLEFARACARDVGAFHAPLIDEIRGHADGQELPFGDLLRIICRQRLGRRRAEVPERGGCISVAWRAPNGHILVGRNYDFYPIQRIRQRIALRPDAARPTVGMRGSVPAGRYDGMNDGGLFVSLHVVLADEPERIGPGVPFHLIPRLLLETCGTAQEALHLITIMPHLDSFNYLLADSTGFFAVECHANRLRIVEPERNSLAVGNFYRHPDMAPLQRNRQQVVSRRRVAWLESGLLLDRFTDPMDATRAMMSHHQAPVCGHEGGHTTLWSALADLTARKIFYAAGAPCSTPYLQVPLPA